MTTAFHAKYWAQSLRLAHPRDGVEALSRSIGNARVDLNPHQVDAALFALRSPYSKGVLLADEVGLGKTIEAALILAQKWAERHRRILLIIPATLRKQWQVELADKFFLPSTILETRVANLLAKKGVANPFIVDDRIVICSYQFAYAKRDLVRQVDWDLVVIDEAHRLRSIYKGTKTAEGIVDAIRPARKLLLTATPLQNSLLELYGLVGILDPELFGSQEAFQAQFLSNDDVEQRDAALRERLQHVYKRTLRRQVLEYIPFTNRFTHTADFVPSKAEQQLYEEVSAYLQRDVLVALPNARRKLITLIMRKLLASSSAAIGATLAKFAARLAEQTKLPLPVEESLAQDFESMAEIDEEWTGDESDAAPEPTASGASPEATLELADLQRFVRLAQSVERDSKASKLVEALPTAFKLAQEKGAARKAVLFTESVKTQEYLFKLLTESGYTGEIVLMNGSNNDETSKRVYAEWKKRNEHRWEDVSSGSKTADMKAAIVDEFRERGTLLLATESAADRLTIIAHDRFQDIVDEAKKGGYTFSTINIGVDVPETPKRTVVVSPVLETMLGMTQEQPAQPPGGAERKPAAPGPEPRFKKPEEVAAAKLALEAIAKVARDPKMVPGTKALQTDDVQKRLVTEVTEKVNSGQLSIYPVLSHNDLVLVIRETTALYVAHTIAIPRVIVLPKGVVRAGFREFALDLSSFRLPPASQEILVQHLASDTREVIGALEGGHDEERLEDYVVRGLIGFDDVSYDEQADLLYKLAGQVVTHLRSYLKDDDEVRNVLLFHQRQIATSVHSQMQQHAWEEASSYEAVVSQGFSEVRSQAFASAADEALRRFDVPIENKADIRKMLFGGFKKCLYPTQKFDSDPERRFAVILEKDRSVLKWFKPGKGVFQIRYTGDNDYEPDFVVETETEKLLCEPKRADQMQDPVVVAKARAAATWCEHATAHETENKGKPWRYLLIPHDALSENMTVAGLAKSFAFSSEK